MDFQFYLNRQGVRGAKGVKGDKGDSPIVSVNKHTVNEYVLQIDNPDGTQIITPNLVGQQIVVNTAGDYVKYDRGSNQFVTVELPSATGEEEGLIRLATDADYTERNEFSAVTPYGLVKNLPSLITTSVDNLIRVFYDEPTDSIVVDTSKIHEDISGVNTTATNALNISRDNTNEINALKSTAISIDDTTTSTDKVWSSSKTSSEVSIVANGLLQTQRDVAALDTDMTKIKPIVQSHTESINSINDSISNLTGKTNPATTTTAGIVKPDGETITVTEDGTITAAGGSAPDNMVTTNTNQSISGQKTFTNFTYFNNLIRQKNTNSGVTDHLDIRNCRIDAVSSSGVAYNSLQMNTRNLNLMCTYGDLLLECGKTGNVILTKYDGSMFNDTKIRINNTNYDVLHTGNLIPSKNLSISNTDADGKRTIDVSQALLDRITALEATVASLQTQIGEISAKLDEINGEEI